MGKRKNNSQVLNKGKKTQKFHKTLEEICNSNETLKSHCGKGLQAIKNEYHQKFKFPDTRKISYSVDFDEALKEECRGENRWDYGIDYDKNLIFAEVHPAQTSEVDCMIKKVQSLTEWIKGNCKNLLVLPKFEKGERQFYWIASGKNNLRITPTSNQARKLAIARIQPVGSVFDYAKIVAKQ